MLRTAPNLRLLQGPLQSQLPCYAEWLLSNPVSAVGLRNPSRLLYAAFAGLGQVFEGDPVCDLSWCRHRGGVASWGPVTRAEWPPGVPWVLTSASEGPALFGWEGSDCSVFRQCPSICPPGPPGPPGMPGFKVSHWDPSTALCKGRRWPGSHGAVGVAGPESWALVPGLPQEESQSSLPVPPSAPQ